MMSGKYSNWYGFKRLDFYFEDREAILIFPMDTNGWGYGRIAVKTEYFNAFQDLERDLVANGFHLAYIKNKNRWGTDADHVVRARFIEFIADEYCLKKRALPIGMSCGGLHAVNFASRYPQLVSMLYLDAPVMNLYSCPMGFGEGESLGEGDSGWQEIVDAYGFTKASFLAYREHPVDRIPTLIKHKIPVALVYGDSDMTVPYNENGAFLAAAYRSADLPLFCVCKHGCVHHPHGLEDRSELLDFIKKFS